MAAKRVLAATVAAGALVSAVPAIAQSVNYEHDHPANEGPVVFESAPMVQALPGAAPAAPQVIERRVEVVPASPPPPPHDHGVKSGHEHAHGQYHPMPAYPGYPGYAPVASQFDRHQFDRSAWLAECRDRIRGVDRKDRGGVIGGLLGAVAGGVAGNRLWDSRRLAGTLLGAGVGGLAGAAIGSAIAASGDRDRNSYDECAESLDRYMAGGYGGHGYGYPGYGYGYAYPAFAYVPVLVQVPQRTIVHETVTEEWVTVPGLSRTVEPAKIIRHAPAPTKRTKLIKGR